MDKNNHYKRLICKIKLMIAKKSSKIQQTIENNRIR